MRGGTLTKKELVEINGRPIIWHVMRIFSAYGHNRFVLPLGYEAAQIKRYFLNYEAMTRDFTVRVGKRRRHVSFHGEEDHPEWVVSLVDTGLQTDKASRLAKLNRHATVRCAVDAAANASCSKVANNSSGGLPSSSRMTCRACS